MPDNPKRKMPVVRKPAPIDPTSDDEDAKKRARMKQLNKSFPQDSKTKEGLASNANDWMALNRQVKK